MQRGHARSAGIQWFDWKYYLGSLALSALMILKQDIVAILKVVWERVFYFVKHRVFVTSRCL